MKAVRIETSPFQVLALVEFESVLKKNQHGCAKVSGYISAEEKDQLMAMISEETWAHIWFYDETGEKNILFCWIWNCFFSGIPVLSQYTAFGSFGMPGVLFAASCGKTACRKKDESADCTVQGSALFLVGISCRRTANGRSASRGRAESSCNV